MHFNRLLVAGAMTAALAFASTGFAKVISGNYCSVAAVEDYPAGVVPVAGWNDYTVPGGYSAPAATVYGGTSIIYNDGSAVPASTSLRWNTPNSGAQNTNDDVNRPTSPDTLGADIQDGNDQMMTGYLQATRFAPTILTPLITFSGAGLNDAFTGSYSIILYIDGDGDVQPNPATLDSNNQYKVTAWTDDGKSTPISTTVYGRDVNDYALVHTTPGNTDFVQVTSTVDGSPTAGNYVMITGLTSDTFYIEIEGVAAGTDGSLNNGGHGVALNGFQIVPEPATIAMIAVGTLLIAHRKRRA